MSFRNRFHTLERLKVAVLVALLAAFVMAWAMMFVHPSVALLIFLFGMIIFASSSFVLWGFNRVQAAEARRALTRSHCPWCDAAIERDHDAHERWHCPACGAEFLDSGLEITHGA